MALSDFIRRKVNVSKTAKKIDNTICVLPWVHLNITPNGKVLHCCATNDYNTFAGDLNKQTLEEVWNSDFMKSLRKEMINGREPKFCANCYDSERVTGMSRRIYRNIDFPGKLNEIPSITKSDGSVDTMDLKFWDFRFSNLCNYKCRTCGPDSSSAWIHDAKKLGWLSEQADVQPYNIEAVGQNTSIEFLRKYIHTVEQINFAGGEPLIMDEHWQILDLLDEHQKYDVTLYYNSNLSVLKYKGKNILDYWSKWKQNIRLLPSIDDIGERAELIRSGTNWMNVENNLKAVNELGIIINPYITVSAMNVFRIPEVIDHLIELGIINQQNNWQNFGLNMVISPPKFHVSILPDNTRKDIRRKLEKYVGDFRQKYNVDILDHFSYLFWHLDKPWHKKNCNDFIEFTKAVDKVRSENTLEIIPELCCIMRS